MKEKCLKVALCLMAVVSLGNALGGEPQPLEQKTIIQETDFASRTDVPYPIASTNVEYLVEKKWVMTMGAFCTVVTVKQPEYVAPPEPLFEDIGYQFEGYWGLFVTDTGVAECKVFDKDGKPAQFIYPGEFNAFSPTSNLYAEWWQTPFGKEKVLYFLARLINEARAGGNDGAQRQVEKYSEEINANPEKWELYVYRAFARFVTLWDDTYVKKFAESCGLDVVNPVLNFAKRGEVRRPDGKIIQPTTPLSLFIQQLETNKNIDQVCGSALPIIESAIADLDEIPDTWSGSVDITAANTGYPFDKHKTYCLDYADAQMIKAMFRGVMSFLELVRGYNQYSAGGVEPDGVNREALAEARKYYLMAVEMLSGFNAAHSRRTDFNDHLFMLVPYESRVLKTYEQAFFDLSWWTAEVDLGPFAEMCFTKQLKPHMSYKQWKNPEEEINRKRDLMRGKRLYVSLRSLFNGEVSRAKGTFPQLINNSVMLAREYGLTDPTLAGTFPELTRKGLGEYISIFDTKMYAYEPETDIKYHAVVYTLPAGATNNCENPHAYMTEATPIVLKEPTFEGHKFTGWSNRDGSGGVIPENCATPMKFTAEFVEAVKVAPGEPIVCDTAEAASNEMAKAVLTPRTEVATVLGTGEPLTTYRNMFAFDVVPTSDGKWAVEAFLKPEAWTNVAESAQEATRQVPLADLAALPLDTPTNVTAKGFGMPGFYYSFYSGSTVSNLGALANEKGRNVLCGTDKDVTFEGVVKPSAAAGFFTIGAKEAPDVTSSDRFPVKLDPPARIGMQE